MQDQRSNRAGKSLGGRTLAYVLMVIVTALWGAPILWMLVTSIKPESEIYAYPPAWMPDAPTLQAYAALFQRFPMLTWFRNSAVVGVLTTMLTLAVDALAAYPLARMQFPGRRVVMGVIFATFLLPYELLFVPLFLGLNSYGLVDSIFSLTVPASANAFGVFLLTQFFQAVPRELEDAAVMDGCSRFGFFWRILLPLTKPGLATVAIFTFVASWNNFFWPLIATNSDETRTLPVGLATLVGGAGMSMKQSVLMASAVVATLPTAIFFLALQRHFVRGIAATGIKG
ncbi:carbohydrate ABC transporter permease [Mesorhizobium sp. MSK_1335]|uniref:Carbohydrate ABC transporter permease n=1 Tax=Mesorhizobium montanum TaxID=3072323 RepID=A0ABU4ZPK2_9HYPH|nr:carbohydrate ABC transporter permease [Mesorhizobium sp. MSK_1335]MDX8526542.1 carbohydrate ABC transporter permease [Mesorhizobium sp. MSK_1335]